MKYKTTIFLTCSIVIILLSCIYGFRHYKDDEGAVLIKEIKYSYDTGCNIDFDKLNLKKEITIENSGRFNTPQEYVALGYNLLTDNDKSGLNYIKEAFYLLNKKTDFYTKFLTIKLLKDNLESEENLYEGLIFLLEGVEKFTDEEHNKYYLEVRKLFLNGSKGSDFAEGRKIIIDSIKICLKNEKKLCDEAVSSYRNLLGTYYIMQGSYSKGVENYLEIINRSDNMENKYFMAKALIDLGTIYNIMHEYETAEKIYEKANEIEEIEVRSYNFIKLYYYSNIIECLFQQEKYDEFFEKANEMYDNLEKYSKGNEQVIESFITQLEFCKVKAYLETGQIEKAKEIIDSMEDLESKISNNKFIDSDMFFMVILGDYYYKIGDYQKAVRLYENVYKAEKSRINQDAKRDVLHRLIEYYQSEKDYEKSAFYSNELINFISDELSNRNSDYLEYIIDKHAYEKGLLSASQVIVRKGIEISILVTVFILSAITGIFIIIILKRNNYIDGLTKLYNRKYFDKQFDNTLKRMCLISKIKYSHKSNKSSYLLMFDIDNFKKKNDSYGHDFGDEVLRAVSRVSQREVKHKGKVFRYGGEEFAVILENKYENEAVQISENIRNSIENLKFSNGDNVTISGGLALVEISKEDTFKNADEKLYVSKNSGKNKITA